VALAVGGTGELVVVSMGSVAIFVFCPSDVV